MKSSLRKLSTNINSTSDFYILCAWGYHDFSSELFCLTVAKKIVGEPFRVSLISGIEKTYASEGYVTIFVENFLSHSTETFRRGSLLCCVSESFRWPKSLRIRGGRSIKIFRRIFLSRSAEKCRRGTLQSFINFGYRKSLDERVGGGECQDFP